MRDDTVPMEWTPACMLGDLSGPDGNFFVVAGRVASCLREWRPEREQEWRERSKAGSYADMLRLIPEYVEPLWTGVSAADLLEEEGEE